VPVPPSVRRLVIERAAHRCEYCQIYAWPLTVDHIMPVSRWTATHSGSVIPQTDPDDLDNLAAACGPCNRAKSATTTVYDPVTGATVQLFNPRQDGWAEHFLWKEEYQLMVGRTPIGRVTVAQLSLNREIYRRQRALLRAAMRSGGPAWP
jgi:hypothetical protein